MTYRRLFKVATNASEMNNTRKAVAIRIAQLGYTSLHASTQPGQQKCTGLFKMIVGVLTTCHTQYT